MEKTYRIGQLAAQAYLAESGHRKVEVGGYGCTEGEADIVCEGPEGVTLVFVTAKRRRKDTGLEPSYSGKRLQRIAMCYLVDNPSTERLSCDVLCVLIGSGGTVTVSCTEGAYVWEREAF